MKISQEEFDSACKQTGEVMEALAANCHNGSSDYNNFYSNEQLVARVRELQGYADLAAGFADYAGPFNENFDEWFAEMQTNCETPAFADRAEGRAHFKKEMAARKLWLKVAAAWQGRSDGLRRQVSGFIRDGHRWESTPDWFTGPTGNPWD